MNGVCPMFVPVNIYGTYLKSKLKEKAIDVYSNIFLFGTKKEKEINQMAY